MTCSRCPLPVAWMVEFTVPSMDPESPGYDAERELVCTVCVHPALTDHAAFLPPVPVTVRVVPIAEVEVAA